MPCQWIDVSVSVLFTRVRATGSPLCSTSVGLGFGGGGGWSPTATAGTAGLLRVGDREPEPGVGAVPVRQRVDRHRQRAGLLRFEIRRRGFIAGQDLDPEHQAGHRVFDVVRHVRHGAAVGRRHVGLTHVACHVALDVAVEQPVPYAVRHPAHLHRRARVHGLGGDQPPAVVVVERVTCERAEALDGVERPVEVHRVEVRRGVDDAPRRRAPEGQHLAFGVRPRASVDRE